MVDQPDKRIAIINLDNAPLPSAVDSVPQNQVRNGVTEILLLGDDSISVDPNGLPDISQSTSLFTQVSNALPSLNLTAFEYTIGTLSVTNNLLVTIPSIIDAFEGKQVIFIQAFHPDLAAGTTATQFKADLIENIELYERVLAGPATVILSPPVGPGIGSQASLIDQYYEVIQTIAASNPRYVLGHHRWRDVAGSTFVDASTGNLTQAGHDQGASLVQADLATQMITILP